MIALPKETHAKARHGCDARHPTGSLRSVLGGTDHHYHPDARPPERNPPPFWRLDAWIGRFFARCFPDRQVLILGPGPVSARRFSQRQQVAIVVTVLMACLWLVGGSIDFVLRTQSASKMGRELARLRATTQADAARDTANRARLAQLSSDLDWRRAQFRTAATETTALGNDLAKLAYLLEQSDLPGGNADLPSRMSRAMAALSQAHERQGTLSVELAMTQTQTQAQAQTAQTHVPQPVAEHQPVPADALPASAAQPTASATLERAPNWAYEWQRLLASQKLTIERALAERESALAEASRAEVARAAAIAERAGALAERDRALAQFKADTEASRQALALLTQQTRDSINEVDRIVASTGLDPNHLAPLRMQDRHNEPGQPRGGPFVPWTNPSPDRAQGEAGRGDGAPDVDRLHALIGILQRLPLSAPVAKLTVTSPFGYRLDPFTGAASLHEGIDLEGARDTPVLVTAPGVVTFVGTRTDYGSMIDVSHGSGLMTRYAHLDRALVKVGDFVALHQEVGLMGATGRATGVHLHYEVRVDGVAQDPANFIEVKSHVLQQK